MRAEVLVEVVESPELYDFLSGSGVVPDDEGVALFLGISEGDVESGVFRDEFE